MAARWLKDILIFLSNVGTSLTTAVLIIHPLEHLTAASAQMCAMERPWLGAGTDSHAVWEIYVGNWTPGESHCDQQSSESVINGHMSTSKIETKYVSMLEVDMFSSDYTFQVIVGDS